MPDDTDDATRAPAAEGRLWRHLHQEWAVLAAAAFVVLVATFQFTLALTVIDETIPREAGAKRFFEITYLSLNSLVPLIALYAIKFARDQALHARAQTLHLVHAREASLYIEITNRFHSNDIKNSRIKLNDLVVKHGNYNSPLKVADFIKEELFLFRHRKDYNKIAEYTAIASFYEYVGLMCYNGQIEPKTVLELLGGPIERYMSYLVPYIAAIRQEMRGDDAAPAGAKKDFTYSKADSVYAYALWLYEQARRHRPFTHPLPA